MSTHTLNFEKPVVYSFVDRRFLKYNIYRTLSWSMLSQPLRDQVFPSLPNPVEQFITRALFRVANHSMQVMPVDFSFFFHYKIKTSGTNLDGSSLQWGGVGGV